MKFSQPKFSRKRNWILLLAVFALLPSLCIALQPYKTASTQNAAPELHILFIGNSFTYFNNMPRLLEAISESVDGPRIKTEMVAIGGAHLEDLWKQGSALAAIRKQHWDFVVMNEHSTLGGGIVNGEKRIGDPANFFKYAEMFDTEIRKSGAKTVIVMTWKDRDDPDRIQTDLNNAFLEFRKKIPTGVILSPVSSAWTLTRKTEPAINLYFFDNHHPSKAGSYLIACTVYSSLTHHSPEGAVATAEGTPIDEETGTVQTGKTKTLVNLTPQIAAKLQQIAWKAEEESLK